MPERLSQRLRRCSACTVYATNMNASLANEIFNRCDLTLSVGVVNVLTFIGVAIFYVPSKDFKNLRIACNFWLFLNQSSNVAAIRTLLPPMRCKDCSLYIFDRDLLRLSQTP